LEPVEGGILVAHEEKYHRASRSHSILYPISCNLEYVTEYLCKLQKVLEEVLPAEP
jgi:hypothetical protein